MVTAVRPSGMLGAETVTAFVIDPSEVTRATTVMVAVLPAPSVPKSQRMVVVPVQVPSLGVTEMNARPAGSESVTTTLLTAELEVFVTVIVNVTGSPAVGLRVDAVFAISSPEPDGGFGAVGEIGATLGRAVPDTVASSFAGNESTSCPSTYTKLSNGPSMVARTTSVTVALAPPARDPISHTMIPVPEQLPWLGVTETSTAPCGSVSVTTTPVAGSGELLVATMLYVRVSSTRRVD